MYIAIDMPNAEYIIDAGKDLLHGLYLRRIAVGNEWFKVGQRFLIVHAFKRLEYEDKIVLGLAGHKYARGVKRPIKRRNPDDIYQRHAVAIRFVNWIDNQDLRILREKFAMLMV